RIGEGIELPRRAGVSSFGFSGINAHAVLEEFVPPATPAPRRSPGAVIALSAKNAEALRRQAENLSRVWAERPDLAVADVARTLAEGREAMVERAAFAASSRDEALDFLRALASGQPLTGLYR